MADTQFDILIKFGLSKEKAAEALQELRKLEEATKRTNKAGEEGARKASLSIRDARKSVQLLGAQLGPLGQVLRYVFNPSILGAALLAKAVGNVLETFRKFQNAIAQSGRNAALSIGDIQAAMLELDLERAKADASFKTSMSDFERHSQRKIEVINAEKAAVLQVLDAREKVDLAAAATPEEQQAVKARYAGLRGQASAQASDKEFAAREQALNEKEAMARQRMREGFALSGRTPDRVKLAVKQLPKELSDLENQIASSDAAINDMEGITTVWGALPYWNDPESYIEQLRAFTSEKRIRQASQIARMKLKGQVLPMTRANAAYDAAEDLFEQVRVGREDLAGARANALLTNQTQWHVQSIQSGSGAAADLVARAASGADALKAGEKIPPEQARAIAQATQLLNLVGQNNQTILDVLGRMNDTQAGFKKSVEALERRVNSNNQR